MLANLYSLIQNQIYYLDLDTKSALQFDRAATSAKDKVDMYFCVMVALKTTFHDNDSDKAKSITS